MTLAELRAALEVAVREDALVEPRFVLEALKAHEAELRELAERWRTLDAVLKADLERIDRAIEAKEAEKLRGDEQEP